MEDRMAFRCESSRREVKPRLFDVVVTDDFDVYLEFRLRGEVEKVSFNEMLNTVSSYIEKVRNDRNSA